MMTKHSLLWRLKLDSNQGPCVLDDWARTGRHWRAFRWGPIILRNGDTSGVLEGLADSKMRSTPWPIARSLMSGQAARLWIGMAAGSGTAKCWLNPRHWDPFVTWKGPLITHTSSIPKRLLISTSRQLVISWLESCQLKPAPWIWRRSSSSMTSTVKSFVRYPLERLMNAWLTIPLSSSGLDRRKTAKDPGEIRTILQQTFQTSK